MERKKIEAPGFILFTNKIFLKNNDIEERAPVCARMRVGMGGGKEGQRKKRRGDSLRMFDPMS